VDKTGAQKRVRSASLGNPSKEHRGNVGIVTGFEWYGQHLEPKSKGGVTIGGKHKPKHREADGAKAQST